MSHGQSPFVLPLSRESHGIVGLPWHVAVEEAVMADKGTPYGYWAEEHDEEELEPGIDSEDEDGSEGGDEDD